MDEWLIIHTPTEVYCWDLGAPTDDEREDLVDRARVSCGLTPEDTGAPDATGVVIMLTFGEPHETLMDRAVVGTAADLAKVNRAKVQAHKAGRAQAARQVQIDAAKTVLAALHPADLAGVIASTKSG